MKQNCIVKPRRKDTGEGRKEGRS